MAASASPIMRLEVVAGADLREAGEGEDLDADGLSGHREPPCARASASSRSSGVSISRPSDPGHLRRSVASADDASHAWAGAAVAAEGGVDDVGRGRGAGRSSRGRGGRGEDHARGAGGVARREDRGEVPGGHGREVRGNDEEPLRADRRPGLLERRVEAAGRLQDGTGPGRRRDREDVRVGRHDDDLRHAGRGERRGHGAPEAAAPRGRGAPRRPARRRGATWHPRTSGRG